MNKEKLNKICSSIDRKLTQYDRYQDNDKEGKDWESEFYEFLSDLYMKLKEIANNIE